MSRSTTPADLAGLCARCWLPPTRCLCALIPRLQSRTRLILVRHAKESWRTSNTGRLLALALPQTLVVEHGRREPVELEALLASSGPAACLYPDGPSEPPPGLATLVILDGSWRQARSMTRRLPALSGLPRWSIGQGGPPLSDGSGGPPRLRRAPFAGALSTLEAVARALGVLEGAELEQALLALHAARVARRSWMRRPPGERGE